MRKLILYGVIIIQIGIVISLIRGIQLSNRSSGRVAIMQSTKQNLEKEQARLIEESKYVGSEFYLEKVARDELNLAKEGETIVMVPSEREVDNFSSSTDQADQRRTEKPNWVKWWDVFIGNR